MNQLFTNTSDIFANTNQNANVGNLNGTQFRTTAIVPDVLSTTNNTNLLGTPVVNTGLFTQPQVNLTPAITISQTAQAYVVAAELPGMTIKDINIIVHGGFLTIRGEKQITDLNNAQSVVLSNERTFGRFERTISFAQGDMIESGKVSAKFVNGILNITLPLKKIAQSNFKKVTVTTK